MNLELHGVKHYGGRFTEQCEILAAKAYDDLAVRLLGPMAQLNFPSEHYSESLEAIPSGELR